MGNWDAIFWVNWVICAKIAKAGIPPAGPAPGPGPGPADGEPPPGAAPGCGGMGGVAIQLSLTREGLATHNLQTATLAATTLLADLLPTMGHFQFSLLRRSQSNGAVTAAPASAYFL